MKMLSLLALLLPLALTSCSRLYELPDPPPQSEWRRHSLSPTEDREISAQNFQIARESVLDFVAAVDDARYDAAYMMLSNETRILLDDLSPTGRGESVLEDGQIERNGSSFVVDPVDLFVVRGFDRLADDQPDERESETYRRKEVYAISTDGTVHRLILIFEENQWRIHRPQIELTPGSPGRRQPDS